MEKLIGKMLDNRYEVLEVIGTGGMAIVYKAKCHRLNRYVALKVMKEEIAQDECLRVLKNDGILIIGAAGDRHLYDLKEAIYDEVRINEVRADLPSSMNLLEKSNVKYRIDIDNNEDIQRLFGMTPYKFRTSSKSFELLNSLDRINTEINVDFYVYKKSPLLFLAKAVIF